METETVMYEAEGHAVDCAGDEGSSSEDEIREAAEELEVLKADKVYYDFVTDVVCDRKIIDDESADPDFVVGPEAELNKEGQVDLKDLEDDSSSSSDESIYEEAVEDVEVKVPPTSLKEAAARYPPFWRVNDKLRREASDGYKSDEDSDYKLPEKCGRCSKAEGEAGDDGAEGGKTECEECHNEGHIDSDDTESTTSSRAEVEDDDLDNLVEMVEDLALPNNDVEIHDAAEGEPEREIVASIVEFDDADYKSDEDPDYVAPIDIDHDHDDSASSADDESSDHEEEDMQE